MVILSNKSKNSIPSKSIGLYVQSTTLNSIAIHAAKQEYPNKIVLLYYSNSYTSYLRLYGKIELLNTPLDIILYQIGY